MRKLWIITALAMFFLSGCGANLYDSSTSIIFEETTTSVETTTTIANTATSTIITTITVTSPTINKPSAQATSETTIRLEATTKKMEKKTIDLHVVTQRGEGTLTFVSAEFDYQNGILTLNYETSDKHAVPPKRGADMPLWGKSGKLYEGFSIGGKGSTGNMMYRGITDFSDLSTVTLTYAFEGYEPVTVTFDIPGI